MAKKKKLPPLRWIKWEDAFNGNHNWHIDRSLPKKITAYHVITVGYEVRRSKHRVTLAMSYVPGDEPVYCDLFTIPVRMIVEERTL